MKHLLISVLLLNSLIALNAVAQTEDEANAETSASTEDADSSEANNEPTQETRNPNAAGEVFIPSEELSEDLPAPFPVDI